MAIETTETRADAEQRLAEAEQEYRAAEAAFDAARAAVDAYTKTHPEELPVRFRFNDRTVFQTPRMSREGVELNAAWARAYEKRNILLRLRGDLRLKLGVKS